LASDIYTDPQQGICRETNNIGNDNGSGEVRPMFRKIISINENVTIKSIPVFFMALVYYTNILTAFEEIN